MANVSRVCTQCGHHFRETKGSAASCRCACHGVWRRGNA